MASGDESLILAFDCSTAACTAALFDDAGALVGARDERIGRGHAERLVPMIAELLEGRTPSNVLVGVGPGSFTGLRVAIAAAHGLAIGWGAKVCGMPSLALLAASAPGAGPVAAIMTGGHGELFVQSFDRAPFAAASDLLNLTPSDAARAKATDQAVGSGAAALVAARGHGGAIELDPSAQFALTLPLALRSLPPPPLRPRPRRPAQGRMSSVAPRPVVLSAGEVADLDEVMAVMADAFSPEFGEAWTRSQCAGILPMHGVALTVARCGQTGAARGFALARTVMDEAELLLIGVVPAAQREGVGRTLLDHFVEQAERAGATRLHLEVRDGNPAILLYQTRTFEIAGRRRNYYRGLDGQQYDALTLVRQSKHS